jgi:hypothetical protein
MIVGTHRIHRCGTDRLSGPLSLSQTKNKQNDIQEEQIRSHGRQDSWQAFMGKNDWLGRRRRILVSHHYRLVLVKDA